MTAARLLAGVELFLILLDDVFALALPARHFVVTGIHVDVPAH
jgi:hypothetical protein